jgi:hypothetical protein
VNWWQVVLIILGAIVVGLLVGYFLYYLSIRAAAFFRENLVRQRASRKAAPVPPVVKQETLKPAATPSVRQPEATPPAAKQPVTTPSAVKQPVAAPQQAKPPVTTPPPVKQPQATPPAAKQPVTTPSAVKQPVAAPQQAKPLVTTPPPTKQPEATPPAAKQPVTTSSPSPQPSLPPSSSPPPKPIMPELISEIENNRRIAAQPWSGTLFSFQTRVWDSNQDQLQLIPANLREELKEAYFDISLANSIVWLATEMGRRSEHLDESYTKLCSGIAQRLSRIKLPNQ